MMKDAEISAFINKNGATISIEGEVENLTTLAAFIVIQIAVKFNISPSTVLTAIAAVTGEILKAVQEGNADYEINNGGINSEHVPPHFR